MYVDPVCVLQVTRGHCSLDSQDIITENDTTKQEHRVKQQTRFTSVTG